MKTCPIFIPGAGRGGTTYLMELLASHPEICGSNHKEPCYFDRNNHLGLEFYENLFPIEDGHKYTVEASTNYLWYPDALEKISQYDERAKLIISLRNPGERAYAEYKRRIEKNGERRSFKEMFLTTGYGTKRSDYLDNVKRAFSIFSEKQVKVLIFEEWKSNPDILLDSFADFLDIKRDGFILPSGAKNKSSVPVSRSLQALRVRYFYSDQSDSWLTFRLRAVCRRTIDSINHVLPNLRSFPSVEEDKEMLKLYYQDQITGLEDILNMDLGVWRAWYES